MVQPSASLAKPRVLVVDEDPSVQYFTRILLHDICVSVSAYSASAAYSLLGSRTFDLVILSLEQPRGEDGLDVLQTLRAIPGCETLPVIGSAIDVQAERRKQWIEHGFDAIISKLPDPLAMRETVRRILGSGASPA